MASIGIIDATEVNKQSPLETNKRPKKIYFGVFFDGTGNNMVQKNTAEKFRKNNLKKNENREISKEEWELIPVEENNSSFKNGSNQIPVDESGNPNEGYSNVAILHSFYQCMSNDELIIQKKDNDIWIYNIYVEGAGTEAIYDGGMKDTVYNWKGSVKGTGHSGVSKLVCKAMAMVMERLKVINSSDQIQTEVHFDVFGFSRGATCARLFSYLALRTNISEKLKCEEQFEDSMAKKYYKNGFLHLFDELNFKNVTVDFLGLYDTVSSIGGVSIDSYVDNVRDYGLYSPTMDGVLNTFHLCAMDEFREHFALTDIGTACIKGNNAEIFIPGCHSDVGGGYKTGENHFKLIYKKKYFSAEKIEVPPVSLLSVNVMNLLILGWCEDNDTCRVEKDSMGFDRYIDVWRTVECGYSNIPLEMMRIRTEKVLKRLPFRSISQSYPIGDSFSQWSTDLLNLAQNATGRTWYYPGDSLSSSSYKSLRKYLHFSSTNAVGFCPSYCGDVICRYIYHGDNVEGGRMFTHLAYL